jgi:hypothetical protein
MPFLLGTAFFVILGTFGDGPAVTFFEAKCDSGTVPKRVISVPNKTEQVPSPKVLEQVPSPKVLD